MSFVFMESLCATFRAGVGTWFCGPKPTAVVVNCDDDDDDDDGCSDECARALAIRHVGTCIDSCVQWLMAATPGSPQPVPECKQLLRDCESMWRSKFKAWQEPCGNHLNVPDLLFVSACHLRVLLMPAADRQTDRATIGSIKRLQTRLTTALREWNRAPSVLHAEHRSVIDTCARVIVLWGSRITSKKLTETTLSAEDVSMLTMNVNVHQNLDNRARNTDLTPIATKALTESSTAIVDDCECLLRDIVCLASRYAFFATLHHAVRMAAANPHNTLHQRVALEAVRPAADLVHANVIKFGALFLECSRTSLPEFVHREINYTIWKWLLSVGSMEAFLRMAPTIEWHKLNPVTVSIREPTAATLPGALVRAVAISDYGDATDEWPDHVQACHRDVWHLTLWHQLFTEIDMHFLDDYVVLAHDIRHKSAIIGRSIYNMHPRRPVIVRACATWCVHAHSLVWHADTLEECLYLWAWLIVRFFDGRDERGVSLLQILHRIGLSFY